MIKELGIEGIEIKESKEPIDERRRATAISSNKYRRSHRSIMENS